jgi:D-arabinonate dehydratase/D-galactarolactone cycloisomerase
VTHQPTTGPAIAKVEAIALAAPFADLYDSAGDVPDWLLHPAASHQVLPRRGQYATIVRVHADDGTVGVGEAYGMPAPEVTAACVRAVLAPLLTGRDALATTALWQLMYDAQAAGGHNRGFYMEALAGVDIALWDLRGKLTGQPVYRMLGGPVRDGVPCYASPVPLLPTPEESAAKAVEYRDAGFTAIKVKIGRGPATDRAHLREVRAALGPDAEILADANCAYTLDRATEVADVLAGLGIRWYEEPLATDDLAALAELRRRTGLTIVNGETHFTRFDVRDSLRAGAVDVVMPNLARCGGITETARVAALASAHHVDVAPHGVGSGVAMSAALHFCAAIPNLRVYEYNQLPNPLRRAVVRTPPEFRDGRLYPPDGDGLGVTLDEDTLDRYTVPG